MSSLRRRGNGGEVLGELREAAVVTFGPGTADCEMLLGLSGTGGFLSPFFLCGLPVGSRWEWALVDRITGYRYFTQYKTTGHGH